MKIIIEAEDTILHSRDPLHIVICEKYPHRVVKAKKGKGSYKRKTAVIFAFITLAILLFCLFIGIPFMTCA